MLSNAATLAVCELTVLYLQRGGVGMGVPGCADVMLKMFAQIARILMCPNGSHRTYFRSERFEIGGYSWPNYEQQSFI